LRSPLYYIISLFFIVGLFSCQKDSIKPIIPDKLEVVVPIDTIRHTKNIVILGSSSAFGTGCTPIDSAWANKLKDRFKNIKFTNLAVGGYVTYTALPTGDRTESRPTPDSSHNLTKALSFHPDLVLLSFPTNDIANGYSDAEIINNYERIVKVLTEAKISYLIFGTQPRDFAILSLRYRLKSLNEKLKNIYSSNYFDYLDSISTPSYEIRPEYSSGDGIHLNNKGHGIIFRQLLSNSLFKIFTK
jgi:acyl-CoA thioesterase-1